MSGLVGITWAARLLGVGSFFKKNWKLAAIAAVALAGYFAFTAWKADLKKDAYNSGFSTAEGQYKTAIDAANARAAADQANLNLFTSKFGSLADLRAQNLQLTLQPRTERITREIVNNPVYRACVVTDSVLLDLNAGRATVDAGIGASNPEPAGR